jgi:CrcB protein
MLNAALVALFGALGALGRLGCSKLLPSAAGGIPWATLLVNGLGSLLLGLLTGWCLSTDALDERWRIALATGFLGSFTTFSTFSVETVQLANSGRYGLAAANTGLHFVVGLSAAAVGFALTRS